MTITYVSAEQFIIEVSQWGATMDTLHKVRRMKKGDKVHMRFSIPGKDETIEASVPMSDYFRYNFMNIDPISVPAVWDTQANELRRLIKKLEEDHGRTTTNFNIRS